MGILIFKRLTARRLYKSFGVKGLSRLNPCGRPKLTIEVLMAMFIQHLFTLRLKILPPDFKGKSLILSHHNKFEA
jgi:hypothetical protein